MLKEDALTTWSPQQNSDPHGGNVFPGHLFKDAGVEGKRLR